MNKFPFPSFSGELCKGSAIPGSQQGDQELQQPVSISGKKQNTSSPWNIGKKVLRELGFGEKSHCTRLNTDLEWVSENFDFYLIH